MKSPRRLLAWCVTVSATVGLSSIPVLPVAAEDPPAPAVTVVADGLNNPRHLEFSSHGDLYIAEAGLGGGPDAPSIGGAEGVAHFGQTGSVTRLSGGVQTRVVTGLPSLAAPDGSGAIGPTDISFQGPQRFAVSIGLGNAPSARATLGPAARALGTVMTGTLSSRARVTADLAHFEAVQDPDRDGADSNPGGMVRTQGGYAVVDAGGNTLLSVSASGRTRTLATLPTSPIDSVPTSVTRGPDGAFYVSELTGFPFTPGSARIWRVVPGDRPMVYATGLTTVSDLAWHRGHLYAVQIADGGLLSGSSGSLVRVRQGAAPETVVDDLVFPYGVAFRGGRAYITQGAVFPGGGSVVTARVN